MSWQFAYLWAFVCPFLGHNAGPGWATGVSVMGWEVCVLLLRALSLFVCPEQLDKL